MGDNILREIEDAAAHYPDRRSALMAGFWAAQREFGSLSDEVIEAVAAVIGVPKAHAQGVAAYHTLYYKGKVGRHVVMLCTNVACTLMGAETLLGHLEGRLGVKVGGTTPDGMFTLMEVECIGSCGKAPAMVVDDDFHYELTPDKIDEILKTYR